MRRREFITLFGGALAWPMAAKGQQPVKPVIGVLHGGSSAQYADLVTVFQQGLKEAGYAEGQNVATEYRWADGHYDRLPALAAELLQLPGVAVLAALGGDPAAVAAKATVVTIPIVFMSATDPVKLGLVSSLNKPGANITGLAMLSSSLVPKQLQLLVELVPTAGTIGLLINPNNPNTGIRREEMREAAHAVARELFVATVGSADELESAFATIRQRAGALVVPPDPFFTGRRDKLIALAARYSLPVGYPFREYAVSGGLMSYGVSLADAYHLVDKI
jgi:putative ABC transport system substrate-binding protein